MRSGVRETADPIQPYFTAERPPPMTKRIVLAEVKAAIVFDQAFEQGVFRDITDCM